MIFNSLDVASHDLPHLVFLYLYQQRSNLAFIKCPSSLDPKNLVNQEQVKPQEDEDSGFVLHRETIVVQQECGMVIPPREPKDKTRASLGPLWFCHISAEMEEVASSNQGLYLSAMSINYIPCVDVSSSSESDSNDDKEIVSTTATETNLSLAISLLRWQADCICLDVHFLRDGG
eukprot:Gb_24824 [translate_table: standard]